MLNSASDRNRLSGELDQREIATMEAVSEVSLSISVYR